jgi:hypothetical protein
MPSKPSLQTILPVQSAFHRFDRAAESDNGFARGLISKLLGRSIFRRNSKYVTSKNMAPTPATIGPPGLSPRPTELYIDCTAAKASAMPSPKQIIAQTYFTAVMMLPPLLTACCKLCLANGPDQAGARLRQCGELEFNQSEREGDDWLARMNESGRCIPGPAA